MPIATWGSSPPTRPWSAASRRPWRAILRVLPRTAAPVKPTERQFLSREQAEVIAADPPLKGWLARDRVSRQPSFQRRIGGNHLSLLSGQELSLSRLDRCRCTG